MLRYGPALRREALLIVGLVALAVAGAAFVSAKQQPVYRASMKVVVGQGNGFFQPQFGGSVQPFTQTMTTLLKSDVVARRVIAARHLQTTPKALLARMNVSSNPESSVLGITYDSESKRAAVDDLRGIGDAFTALVREKLSPPARTAGVPPITASVFDPAHLEPGTVSPRRVRNMVLAGALALVIGVALAAIRESLRPRLDTRDDAERSLGAPVIGAIPKLSGGAPRLRSDRGALQALDMLRANLELAEGGPGSTVAVTSALAGEGKTTLVASLGPVLAESGANVICVDADLRAPKLGEYLGCAASGPGLVDVVSKTATVAEVLQEVPLSRPPVRAADGSDGTSVVEGGRLRVLLHGTPGAQSARVLRSGAVDDLLNELREAADYVLIDTPPLLAAADAFALTRAADTAIVVVRQGWTPREAAEAAAATLASLGVHNRSVVLNGVRRGQTRGYLGIYAGHQAVGQPPSI